MAASLKNLEDLEERGSWGRESEGRGFLWACDISLRESGGEQAGYLWDTSWRRQL